MVRSQPSGVSSWIGPSPYRRPLPPATAKAPSSRPNRSTAARTAPSAAAASARSAAAHPTAAPTRTSRSARARAWSAERETTNTEAPSAAHRTAVAAAMPVEPVIRMARSRSRSITGW